MNETDTSLEQRSVQPVSLVSVAFVSMTQKKEIDRFSERRGIFSFLFSSQMSPLKLSLLCICRYATEYGSVLEMSGMTNEAERYFRLAVELDKSEPDAWSNLGRCMNI